MGVGVKTLRDWVLPAVTFAWILGPHLTSATAAPQLNTQFEVRNGFIALDRKNTRLEMGADGGGPLFKACPNLTPVEIEAQAVRHIEQQLRARGTVLQQFAIGLLDLGSPEAVKQRFVQAGQALERDRAADKSTAALSALSRSWTDTHEAMEAWQRDKQGVTDTPFLPGRDFNEDVFASTLNDFAWFDGPARVPKNYVDDLRQNAMAFAEGKATFEIAPPFRKQHLKPDGSVASMLRPTANLAEWGDADLPELQPAGRLQGSLKALSDEMLAPLDCQLWSRARSEKRVTEYLGLRGVSVGEFQQRRAADRTIPSGKPVMPPPLSAGVDPLPTDYSFEEGGGRVLLSPDPLANRLFVLVDPAKDDSLLKKILYLTVPTRDWDVIKGLPPDRVCFYDALKRAPGLRAVRLSYITSPDLAFSKTYLTRRALAERTQRVADMGYGVKLALGEEDGTLRRKYASVLVEPKAGTTVEDKPSILMLPPCTAEDGVSSGKPPENVNDPETPALVPQPKVVPAQRTKDQPKHEIKVGANLGGGLAPKLWAEIAMPGITADDSLAGQISQQSQVSTDVTYSRDFVGFGDVFSRRVQLSLRGFSLIDPAPPASAGQGQLRRKGFEGRATADLFRDWQGMFAQADLSAEKHSVRDLEGASPLPDVTKLSAGINFARSIQATRRSPHTELGVSFTRGRIESGEIFTLVKADAAHQQFVGAFSRWDLRFNTSIASSGTPTSEWPRFGGEDSVRGYAADASLARRTWTVQNEYWFLPPGVENSESSLAATFRKMATVAVFADVGELRSAPSHASGRKLGLGFGLRLVVSDFVTLRLDRAHPVGERDPSFDRKGKWYLTVTTRRQL